jgi:probable phosphoglycerate mutase
MTRTLLLLRHGRTAWNLEGRMQGHADVPLDGVGREQAVASASALARVRPDRLWSSDLARARQTAEVIGAACGLEVVLDPRLREYDVGERSGLTVAEFAAQWPEQHAAWRAGRSEPRVAGEESHEQVASRVGAALRGCLDTLADGQTGVMVLHGACLKVGLGTLLGWSVADSRALVGLPNCHAARVVDDEHGVRLASYDVGPEGWG